MHLRFFIVAVSCVYPVYGFFFIMEALIILASHSWCTSKQMEKFLIVYTEELTVCAMYVVQDDFSHLCIAVAFPFIWVAYLSGFRKF